MNILSVIFAPVKATLMLSMLAFAVTAVWPACAEEIPSSILKVRVSGLSQTTGDVRISIYDSRSDWLENSAYDAVIPVDGDSVIWNVTGLVPGQYAIASFHDTNSNGQCDRNFLGIPTEAFGFSNNVRPKFSAPKWALTKFDFTEGMQHLEITLK